jgi:nitroreductase/Pyruvate/2-oxoacid:ferredoxin oxidoreductase delta subunit
MLQFTVDSTRCTHCGLCASDCISRIIQQSGDSLPTIAAEQEEQCMQCQHCLAICPSAAISIFGKNPDQSISLSASNMPSFDQMTQLIRGRRSVRHYRDENVDLDLIQQLLTTVANAPTGVNERELTFSVIDDKDIMHQLQTKVYTGLVDAAAANRIPDRLAYMRTAAALPEEQATKLIFRTAPHALFVSAPPDAPCGREDIALTLAYFELLAQSAGLGTVWWGMVSLVLAVLPELKAALGIPSNHLYYGMLFGKPVIQFARTVQRDEAAVIRSINAV